jgi:hypothetical protein
MDFMSDLLRTGRRIRVLNVLDVLSREALANEVDTSVNGHSNLPSCGHRKLPTLVFN